MLATILGPIGLGLIAAVCLIAAARGSRFERTAALVLAAGTALEELAQAFLRRPDPTAPLTVIDLGVLWALVRLTWKPGRVWPMFAVGAQSLIVALHLLRWTDPDAPMTLYLRALAAGQAGVLAALAVGVPLKRRKTDQRSSSASAHD